MNDNLISIMIDVLDAYSVADSLYGDYIDIIFKSLYFYKHQYHLYSVDGEAPL